MGNPFLSTTGAVEQQCHIVWVKLGEITPGKALSLFQTIGFDDYRPLRQTDETFTKDSGWWQLNLPTGSSVGRRQIQKLEQDPRVLYTFKFG